MTERNQVYKCNVCGNITEVFHPWVGELVCCGQPMQLLVEWTVDAATEKHVPVVVQKDGWVLVKVGEVDHPMEEAHYIEWIELIDGDKIYRQHLSPGQQPEAFFPVQYHAGLIAREYCNLHGLWKNA